MYLASHVTLKADGCRWIYVPNPQS